MLLAHFVFHLFHWWPSQCHWIRWIYSLCIVLVGGLEHDFYDFPYIGNNNPNWLIFFRGVQTTNQCHSIILFHWLCWLFRLCICYMCYSFVGLVKGPAKKIETSKSRWFSRLHALRISCGWRLVAKQLTSYKKGTWLTVIDHFIHFLRVQWYPDSNLFFDVRYWEETHLVKLVFTGQAPGLSFLSVQGPCFHGEWSCSSTIKMKKVRNTHHIPSIDPSAIQ